MPNSSGGCDPWSRPSPSPGPFHPRRHRRPWTQASGLASGLGPGRAISKAPGAPSPPALTRLALGPFASGHPSASETPAPLRVPSRGPLGTAPGTCTQPAPLSRGRRRGWGGGVTGARDAALAKGSLQVGRGQGQGQGQVQGQGVDIPAARPTWRRWPLQPTTLAPPATVKQTLRMAGDRDRA